MKEAPICNSSRFHNTQQGTVAVVYMTGYVNTKQIHTTLLLSVSLSGTTVHVTASVRCHVTRLLTSKIPLGRSFKIYLQLTLIVKQKSFKWITVTPPLMLLIDFVFIHCYSCRHKLCGINLRVVTSTRTVGSSRDAGARPGHAFFIPGSGERPHNVTFIARVSLCKSVLCFLTVGSRLREKFRSIRLVHSRYDGKTTQRRKAMSADATRKKEKWF